MSNANNSLPPDALLFIAPGCPHCPVVLQGLADLVKEGLIGTLEVVNVAVHPERAAALNVRMAPWTRLGPFKLEGAQTPAALRRWAERVSEPEAVTDYLATLLGEGELDRAEAFLAEDPTQLARLLPLVADPAAPMQVRLGASAVLESYAGTAALQALVPELLRLAADEDHRVRGDACHYLGLSGAPMALPALESCLNDPHPEVREIARDALETLRPG